MDHQEEVMAVTRETSVEPVAMRGGINSVHSKISERRPTFGKATPHDKKSFIVAPVASNDTKIWHWSDLTFI